MTSHTTALRALATGLLLALLAACSSTAPSYRVDHDPDFAFSSFKTYRWYDDVVPSKDAAYRRYNGSDARIRDAVDSDLAHKGFVKGHGESFDFLVNYRVSTQVHESIDNFTGYDRGGLHGSVGGGTYGRGMSIGYSTGSAPRTRSYAEGTAVLDVIDAASGNVVWRGVAEGRLKKDASLADKQRATLEVVETLLADFPPS